MTLCVFFRNLIKEYAPALLSVFGLRRKFFCLKIFFGTMRIFRKKIEIILEKRDILYFHLEKLWFPSPVCILWGLFGILWTLYLSAIQWKETQADTKHIQSSINR